jgi:hypothetical protein
VDHRPTVRSHPTRAAVAGVLLAAGGAVLALALPTRADEHFGRPGETIILEPRAWVSKPLPLRPYILTDAPIERGKWTVVFYQNDCTSCRHELPGWIARARAGQGEQVLFLNVSPDGGGALVPDDGSCWRGRLTPDRTWFMQTPAVVRLHHGVVTLFEKPAE